MLPTQRAGPTRCVYFVNAHTLNLAAADPAYREVLNAADYVFGDGTGVRWAARLQGVRVHDNLVGTDLVPQLLRADRRVAAIAIFSSAGCRSVIDRAAAVAAAAFPGWTQAGFHHGFFHDRRIDRPTSFASINRTPGPTCSWSAWAIRSRSNGSTGIAISWKFRCAWASAGCSTYWAGDLRRAPTWLRRCGAEWLGILFQQPHKARRYLLGNPLFLWRAIRSGGTG